MSNLKSILKEHINEIILDMNEELLNDRIVRYWNEDDSDLTLREYVNKYWEKLSEFSVDLGVSFGKIFELYLPRKLNKLGYNVNTKFTSNGDMEEVLSDVKSILWEIKTGRGEKIQGATHSPKEHKVFEGYLQVLWECFWDTPLTEILETRRFISNINVSAFTNTTVSSSGKPSNVSSITSVGFKSDRYDDCVDACVYGKIKKNPVNVKFIKEEVVYAN